MRKVLAIWRLRLNDIYQSSTVYMTFPSNRTKRYEHSIGTMEIASSMLFSAVTNADNDTRSVLFEYLRKYLGEIFELAIMRTEEQTAPYFTRCRDNLSSVFESAGYTDSSELALERIMRTEIKKAMENGSFTDSALDCFQYYPMDMDQTQDIKNVENVFLYRCLLQATRIVALFHDVGHPPYSHIIETVLEGLYQKYVDVDWKNEWQKKQLESLKKCLTPYITKENKKAYSSQAMYSQKTLVDAHLHERVGLKLLQSAINDIIPNLINNTIDSEKNTCCKIGNVLYYIVVVEFAMAILNEKDIVFKSFHKIVDGILDSDRLDYIMRDSLNSGVNWGEIPYKRLINSAKLFYLKENGGVEIPEDERPFVIAYPKKVVDDIEDLLLIRYKIFARINFHHRCKKTSVALQTAVKQLAENCLESDSEDKCINPEINILWNALDSAIGNQSVRIIQWNDSWLISVLHKALVKIKTKGGKSRTTQILQENLEEILLNKKRYYSLLKRGRDSKHFVDKIFEHAGLDENLLKALEFKEYKKYYNNGIDGHKIEEMLSAPGFDAVDSIRRVKQLRNAKDFGDIESLYRPLPLLEQSLEESIEDVLEEYQKAQKIADYKIFVNEGKKKTGLPNHRDLLDEIYLYKHNEIETFDDRVTLRDQIKAIENGVLWVYIYFVPDAKYTNVNELAELLIDAMAKKIGGALRQRYEELFGRIIVP